MSEGKTNDQIAAEAENLLRDDGFLDQPDTFTIRPANLSELLTTELKPVEYLHAPHVPAGRRIWVFGAASAGKSLWAMWVATQVARGGRRVLFFSEENPLDEDIRRLKRLDPDPAFFHYVYGSGLDLTQSEHVEALLAATKGVDLVVLDTLTATWTGDEGDNAAIAALDRDLLLPLIRAGSTVIVLDHTGHPQAFVRRGGVNAGRGASSKGQKADVVLNFVSKGHGEFMVDASAKFRVGDGRGPGEMLLRVLDTQPLDIETITDTHTVRVNELADEMVRAIEDAGELTTNRLRSAVEGKKEHQTEAMNLLESEDPARVKVAPGPRNSKIWSPVLPPVPNQSPSTRWRQARPVVTDPQTHPL